jgi:hypothetical protein
VAAVISHLKAETFGDDDIVGGRETEAAKLRGWLSLLESSSHLVILFEEPVAKARLRN